MIPFPSPSEYAPFYSIYMQLIGQYIKDNEVEDIVEILSELGKTTKERFAQFSEQESLFKYEEGKWSIKELFGHMIDTEQIMSYRALAFSRGEEQSLTGFDQDKYIEGANFDAIPYADLLSRYQAVRKSSIALFKNLDNQQVAKVGKASNNEMSVRALIYMIAGHEIHHLNILEERYVNQKS